MLATIARVVTGGAGLVLVLAAIATAGLPGADPVGALTLFVPGVVLVAVALLERGRYRSLHAERTGTAAGPGGGDPELPGPSFRPTPERFVDPSSGLPVRVWIDPATGERRYVAER